MDISRQDRDKLRQAQHKLSHPHVIGNIIEHKTQDPRKYKQISDAVKAESLSKDEDNKRKTPYKSKFYQLDTPDRPPLTTICEDKEPDLPIPLKEVQANLWLNMDQVEFDKLEWMSSKAEKLHQNKMRSTTRFDKEGRALPLDKQKANTDQVDDSEGHDIESLVALLDSAYQPQVTYALNVVEKIATLANMGYYDGAFDENILQNLMTNCLLRARHQLDSPNESICQSALKCLRALLCNTQVDEVVMDRIHPIVYKHKELNPWLRLSTPSEFTIEMKDIECVEADAILALIERTDLVRRFKYLLSVKVGPFSKTYCECILDLLIRMARHSPTVCCKHLNGKDLMALVIKLFLPLSITEDNKHIRSLSVKAMKFVRLVAQASIEVSEAQEIISDYDGLSTELPSEIVPVLESYHIIDCFSLPSKQADQLFRLHIETLRMMKILCDIEVFRSKIVSILALSRHSMFRNFKALQSMKATKVLEHKISFDWQYAAHFFDLIGCCLEHERDLYSETHLEMIWIAFIKPILFQWITDLVRSNFVPHIDVSIAIASAIPHFRNRFKDNGQNELIAIMIDPITKDSQESKGRNMNLFKRLVQEAITQSSLPNILEDSGKLRDPKCLPSYGCLNFNAKPQYNFKLSTICDSYSPFLLLDTYIALLNEDKARTIENLKVFIDSPELVRYIRLVANYQSHPTSYEESVQRSMIAQFETQIVCRSLITLGNYYTDAFDGNEFQDSETTTAESRGSAESHEDCYANLCYYAITMIGILRIREEQCDTLKDKLLDGLLLNYRLKSRLIGETFIKSALPLDDSSDDVPMVETLEKSDLTAADCLCAERREMDGDNLRLLAPLFMSLETSNRFWIFKPILIYYQAKVKELENANQGVRRATEHSSKNNNPNYWFLNNISWRINSAELMSKDDFDIIRAVLCFNYMMLRCSPPYNHLVVKPNIEDYICLLGTVFLDDKLFLDVGISNALSSNLKKMLRDCISKKSGDYRSPFPDASRIIEPMNLPLADFFHKLVDQFEAASYGDIAFSNYILLFITPDSDKTFRRYLFQDKVETCVRQLRLGGEQLWTSRDIFFNHREKDPEILGLFKRAGPFLVSDSFLHLYCKFHLSLKDPKKQ